MRAKTKTQYIEAWDSHVTQLTSVFLEANVPVDEWDTMLDGLKTTIRTAADKLEAEGVWDAEPLTCGACTTAIGAHTKQEGCELRPRL